MIHADYEKVVRRYLKIQSSDHKPDDWDEQMKSENEVRAKDGLPPQGWPPPVPKDVDDLFTFAHKVLTTSCGIPNFRNESAIILLIVAMRERAMKAELMRLLDLSKTEKLSLQQMRKQLKDKHGIKWDDTKRWKKDECEAKLAELVAVEG